MVAYDYIMNLGYRYGTLVKETPCFFFVACEHTGKVKRVSRRLFEQFNAGTAEERRKANAELDSMYS